jgi:hypothetical protein
MPGNGATSSIPFSSVSPAYRMNTAAGFTNNPPMNKEKKNVYETAHSWQNRPGRQRNET